MPIGPVVAVEISTAAQQPRFDAALIAACSRAAQRGKCVLADASAEARRAEGIAIVSWQGATQEDARVQVGVRRANGGTAWLSRDVHFHDADAPVERWRAIGLTIATLVGELPEPAQLPARSRPAPAPAPRPAPTAVPRRTGKPIPQLPARWWIEAGGLVGPGLDTGTWRGGGWLGAARRFDGVPLFVHASAAYAVRPEDVRGLAAQWLVLAAGPGATLDVPAADLALDFRVAAELERIHASALLGGAEDSGSRWVPGLRGGASVAWPRGYLSVVVGAEMWAIQSATTIRVGKADAGRVPALGGELVLGVRAGLP